MLTLQKETFLREKQKLQLEIEVLKHRQANRPQTVDKATQRFSPLNKKEILKELFTFGRNCESWHSESLIRPG